MPAGFNVTLRNSRSQQIRDAIDAAGTAGTMKVYTTPRPPTTGGSVTTQTLLGTLTFSYPCGTCVNGVLTFGAIAEDPSADATGTAVWGRIANGSGLFVMDVDVGLAGSNAQMIMNTVAIAQGGPIRCDSGVITEGNA